MYIYFVKRTQIYLEESQHRALQQRARREGKSLAALIRECVATYLYPSAPPANADPLSAVIGVGKGDGACIAERVDDYLYGAER